MKAKIINKIEIITDRVIDFWEEYVREFDSSLKAKLFLIGLLLVFISAIGITTNEIKKIKIAHCEKVGYVNENCR